MVLESKDQLITENDLTLKPSVEKNHLSLAYHLSCRYSQDACPVGSLQMGQSPQRLINIATSTRRSTETTQARVPIPKSLWNILLTFKGTLAPPLLVSQAHYLLYPWSPDTSAAEDLSKIHLSPFLTSTQGRSDTID